MCMIVIFGLLSGLNYNQDIVQCYQMYLPQAKSMRNLFIHSSIKCTHLLKTMLIEYTGTLNAILDLTVSDYES